MKFLVLGCNGMAGHMISLYLKEQGHDVLGFAHKKSTLVNSIKGDARNAIFLREVIGFNKFDTIINCIGLLNKTCEEHKADAVYINSYLPHQLVQFTEGSNTQVIHMSTDCVFSGKRGQYTENDIPDGTTFYDRTKALGEISNGKDLTLRQSIIGPDISPKGIGLLNWFMQQHNNVYGYTKAVWTGQTTLQLAKTIEVAAKEKISGLYNIVPNTSITKYELLNLFNQYLRKEKIKIIPTDKCAADKSLKRTNWEFDYCVPCYEQMIVELAVWIQEHKNLYSHYNL